MSIYYLPDTVQIIWHGLFPLSLCNLPSVTYLVGHRHRLWTLVCVTPKHMFCYINNVLAMYVSWWLMSSFDFRNVKLVSMDFSDMTKWVIYIGLFQCFLHSFMWVTDNGSWYSFKERHKNIERKCLSKGRRVNTLGRK